MNEEQAFDFQYMIREPSLALKLYVLFLLFVCVVTAAKLVKVCIRVPPFRRPASNGHEYVRLLERTAQSLNRWTGAVFLSFGILFSTSLYNVCNHIRAEKNTGQAVIAFIIQDYAEELSIALYVVAIVYAASWFVQYRLERLR